MINISETGFLADNQFDLNSMIDTNHYFHFFACACAQSFYRPSPILVGQRARYTGGPRGLLSYFITELLFLAVFHFYIEQFGMS